MIITDNEQTLDAGLKIATAAHHTGDNYWSVAKFLMRISYDILSWFHLEDHPDLFVFVYAVLVFILSFGIGLILQWIIVKIVTRLSHHWTSDIYNNLVGEKFFTRICRIIPAVFFLIFIQFTLTSHVLLADWLTRITFCYIIILVSIALCSVVDVTWIHIDNRENKRKLPLKGVVSLTKGIIWIIATIIIIALLANKSPGALLAGLGAFAAVLMLVFKDSILGVVAGIQLSENDSLHVGDWIKVGDANGTVQEVTLTQVKVQNFDKTITTVPPYSLIGGGFTNYREMQLSNTRRVERSYLIDSESVVAATEQMLDEYAKIPLLTDWIVKKRAQKAAGKVENVFNSEGLVDGSIESNLGVFRAYLRLYLDQHPHVAHIDDGTVLTFITTLPQTAAGIPLQLYFFTSTSQWAQYEAICATVFEHIAVMLYRFNLNTFEYATSTGAGALIEGIFPAKAPKGDVPGSSAPPVKENPDVGDSTISGIV